MVHLDARASTGCSIPQSEAAFRAQERAQRAAEKEQQRLYADARERETAGLQAELAERIEELTSVLAATLVSTKPVDPSSLKDDSSDPNTPTPSPPEPTSPPATPRPDEPTTREHS